MSTVVEMKQVETLSHSKHENVCLQCNGRMKQKYCRQECLCSLVEGHQILSHHKNSKHLEFLSKLKLRFLCGDDIDCLKELCKEWFPINYPDSWYNLVIFNERFYSMAATLDGKVIAVLIAEIKPRFQVPKEDSDLLSFCFHKDTQIAYVLSLGVHHPHRRHGVASFLLQNFLWYVSTCLTAGMVKAVYLHVLTTNLVAIKFYQGHNFKLLHYLPSYYVIDGIPKDGYSYVLHINGGRMQSTCMDYLTEMLRLVEWLSLCAIPKRFCGALTYFCKCLMPWSSPKLFISKSRQCHNL